jgi:hypothetical protein
MGTKVEGLWFDDKCFQTLCDLKMFVFCMVPLFLEFKEELCKILLMHP